MTQAASLVSSSVAARFSSKVTHWLIWSLATVPASLPPSVRGMEAARKRLALAAASVRRPSCEVTVGASRHSLPGATRPERLWMPVASTSVSLSASIAVPYCSGVTENWLVLASKATEAFVGRVAVSLCFETALETSTPSLSAS